jgi:hypothetical protein
MKKYTSNSQSKHGKEDVSSRHDSFNYLLYNYLNRKLRLHVNSQPLEISTLIGEKRKINKYPLVPL